MMQGPGVAQLGFREKKQLSEWLEWKGIRMQLLYSAMSHGCDASLFHENCDGQGPTVTIVYNLSGFIFGGYTEQIWDQDPMGRYIYGSNRDTFIFRFRDNGRWSPVKFEAIDTNTGIYAHSSHGPNFGRKDGGEALRLFTGSTKPSSLKGHYILDNPRCFFTLEKAFNTYGTNDMILHGGDTQFLDIQVYKVEESPFMMPDTGTPWRKFNHEWNEKTLQDLRNKIIDYRPTDQIDVRQARILLVGPVGAGKSSFPNTVQSSLRGEVTPTQAPAGSTTSSLTTKFRTYNIRARRGGPVLNFQLCDTMGLAEEEADVMVADFDHFLEGHVPDRYQFNPVVGVSRDMTGYIEHPTFSQKMHVLVLVIGASDLPANVLSPTILEKLRVIKDKAVKKAVPVVVLLTKVDLLSDHQVIAESVKNVFKSQYVLEAVNDVAIKMGLPRSQVLVVKNYEHEQDVDGAVDILSLKVMDYLLTLADIYFDEQCDYLQSMNELRLQGNLPHSSP